MHACRRYKGLLKWSDIKVCSNGVCNLKWILTQPLFLNKATLLQPAILIDSLKIKMAVVTVPRDSHVINKSRLLPHPQSGTWLLKVVLKVKKLFLSQKHISS